MLQNGITAAEVADAFEQTELGACNQLYFGAFNSLGSACAMGAVYAHTHRLSKKDIAEKMKGYNMSTNALVNDCHAWLKETYGYHYIEGFGDGFDGKDLNNIWENAPGVYHERFLRGKQGYEDGGKAREICLLQRK